MLKTTGGGYRTTLAFFFAISAPIIVVPFGDGSAAAAATGVLLWFRPAFFVFRSIVCFHACLQLDLCFLPLEHPTHMYNPRPLLGILNFVSSTATAVRGM